MSKQSQRTKNITAKRRTTNRMRSRMTPVLNERSEIPLCLLMGAMVAEVGFPKPTGSNGSDVVWSLIGGAVVAAILIGALRRIRPAWSPLGRSVSCIALTAGMFWWNLPGQFGLELVVSGLLLSGCVVTILVKRLPTRTSVRTRRSRKFLSKARIRVAAAVAVVLGGLTFVVAIDSARSMQNSLAEASSVAESAGSDLQALEFERAANKLERAAQLLGDFDELALSRGGRVLKSLPILGYQHDYLVGVAGSLRDLAVRSRTLVQQGPLQILTAQSARLEPNDIDNLSKPINDVLAISGRVAEQNANASPWVWNRLTKSTKQLAESVAASTGTLATLLSSVQAAKFFMGSEGMRTYAVVVMSPSKLGLLGGSPVALGELVFKSGTASLDFRQAPNGKVASALAQLEMTPDFQDGAQRMVRRYSQVMGRNLDGVISLDLRAIANLMKLAGDVQVDGLTKPLTPQNLEEHLVSVSPGVASQPAGDQTVGDISQAIFNKLVSGRDLSLIDLVRALATSVRDGTARFWFPEFQVGAIAAKMNGLGMFEEPTSIADFALLARTSTTGFDSKVRRVVTADMKLNEDGDLTSRFEVKLTNTSEQQGATAYNLYSLGTCVATLDGKTLTSVQSRRLLWKVTTVQIPVPPKSDLVVKLSCEASTATEGLSLGTPKFRSQITTSNDIWTVRVKSPSQEFVYDGAFTGNSWQSLGQK